MVGEDLVTPPVDGGGKAGQLGDIVVGGVLEEHDQAPLRVSEIVGCVDLGEQLASQPDSGDLTVDVTSSETGAEIVPFPVIEVAHVINSSRRIP